jgi:hypothetical protein
MPKRRRRVSNTQQTDHLSRCPNDILALVYSFLQIQDHWRLSSCTKDLNQRDRLAIMWQTIATQNASDLQHCGVKPGQVTGTDVDTLVRVMRRLGLEGFAPHTGSFVRDLHLRSLPLNFLRYFPKLERVSVSEASGVISDLSYCPQLERVVITGATDAAAFLIASYPSLAARMTRLRYLELESPGWISTLKYFSQLPALEELVFRRCGLLPYNELLTSTSLKRVIVYECGMQLPYWESFDQQRITFVQRQCCPPFAYI